MNETLVLRLRTTFFVQSRKKRPASTTQVMMTTSWTAGEILVNLLLNPCLLCVEDGLKVKATHRETLQHVLLDCLFYPKQG
jgi:hypothetical protein